ncbi:MAG: lipopolysaccharide biosynthesis protein [Oribacterium sp.]|nr:lipopolysaccharide biosynthesis protein [Oribacterium sp.]
MNETNLKGKVLSGLFWKFLEQCGAQGIQFIVALVLARLMTPTEYGTIGLITVFITIANTFVQSGFSMALVQGKHVDDEDYSSVLWLSLGLAGIAYIALYAAAPAIAAFYRTDVLIQLVRVMGIMLFPGAVVSIQTAFVARNLAFKKMFQSTMGAVVVSGVLAILYALRGGGIWAMALQQIAYYFSLMLFLFFEVPWRPHLLFSRKNIRQLFSFGWKILVSGLLDTIWQNIYALVIGRKYTSADLGAYNRGEQFPKIIVTNLSQAVQSVMLPAYSKLQDDTEALRSMARRSMKLSAFLIFPMMAGLSAVAEPLIRLLLGEKWMGAVPYLVIMAVSYAVYPVHIINLQIINAKGRSDLFLKLEIIKKILGIAILAISISQGIWIMMLWKLVDEYLCTFINAWPNRRLIGYGPGRQYLDLLPTAAISAVMGVMVWRIEGTPLGTVTTLLLQIIAGVVVYAVLSWLFNRECLIYLLKLVGKG